MSDTPRTDAIFDGWPSIASQKRSYAERLRHVMEFARQLERNVAALAKAYVAERDALLAIKHDSGTRHGKP